MHFRKVTLILFWFLFSFSFCYEGAQSLNQNSNTSPSSLHFSDVEFRISGTSNVRDWDIISDFMGGTIRFGPAFAQADENTDNPNQWIEEVYLYIPNQTLESGNRVMNQTMKNSLESETYANLEYRMKNVEKVLSGTSSDEKRFIVNGVVSAAGAEHELKHEVFVLQISEETFRIYGDFDLKMTDLEVEPPTFMRGALTTADDVRIDYKFTVTVKN